VERGLDMQYLQAGRQAGNVLHET